MNYTANMQLPKKIAFLGAPRFWVMVIGALSLYAKSKGWIGDPETILIATISAGFIAVDTIDRTAEKIGGKTEISGSPQ